MSPYVTECPYCGARLRRRAPKLEREGDELRVRESLRARRRRILRERRAKLGKARPRLAIAAGRPYVTMAAILVPAIVVVVQRAGGYSFSDLGIIDYPLFNEAWRYVTSPFIYDHIGYLFVVGLALAIVGPGLERRLGAPLTAFLYLASGILGMLAAVEIDKGLADGIIVAGGGNAIALGAVAASATLRRAESIRDPGETFDQIGFVVAASVILLLPVFEDLASPWAGVVGGLIGLIIGSIGARLGMLEH